MIISLEIEINYKGVLAMMQITEELRTVRTKVKEAYNLDNGYFYSTIPHVYNEYIDGMAWNAPLIAACLKIGDRELAALAQRYVQTIINVGKGARTFAPIKVDDEWKKSETIPGLWYKEKPQSHAGPLGLKFAIDSGARIQVPDYLKEKWKRSIKLTRLGWAFGFSVKYISALKQHTNTMFSSYLAKGKKPSWSMRWMYKENPYFSYIGRKKCVVEYPDMRKLTNTKKTKSKKVVEMKYTKPTTWLFRRDPRASYEGDPTNIEYVPIARLTAEYLQMTL